MYISYTLDMSSYLHTYIGIPNWKETMSKEFVAGQIYIPACDQYGRPLLLMVSRLLI